MYASDFLRLYALLNKIETLHTSPSPEIIGALRAEAAMCRIAIDVCVVPKFENVELLNEVSTRKQESNADGSTGNNGVSV